MQIKKNPYEKYEYKQPPGLAKRILSLVIYLGIAVLMLVGTNSIWKDLMAYENGQSINISRRLFTVYELTNKYVVCGVMLLVVIIIIYAAFHNFFKSQKQK